MNTSLCDSHIQFLTLMSLLTILDHLLGILFSCDALELNSIIRYSNFTKPT